MNNGKQSSPKSDTDEENEFSLSEDDTKAKIQTLRSYFKESTGRSFEESDEVVMRFLRLKAFDTKKAFESIQKYKELKLKYSELFSANFDDFKTVFDHGVISVLRGRRDGQRIVVVKTRNFDTSIFSVDDGGRAAFYLFEKLLLSEETQRKGIVVILNHEDVSLSQAVKLVAAGGLRHCIRANHFMQGGYPIKVDAIYCVNMHPVFIASYNAIKYAVSKKMRDRLVILKPGSEQLLKYFGDEILPRSLGGTLSEDCAWDKSVLMN